MTSRLVSQKFLLSVVVPVYNGEKFAEGCLKSLQTAVLNLPANDLQAVEIIICDNHSTDRTLEIASDTQFVCAYRVMQTEHHFENRTYNWHHGLSQALGEWMVMLHIDDLIAPDGLRAMLAACRNPATQTASLISGRHRTFSEDMEPSSLRPTWPIAGLIRGESLRQHVLPFHCPFVPFTVMRRALYIQEGGLNLNYELVQDWDLWIRLLAQGNLYYSATEFGLWRLHGFSKHYAQTFAREHLLLGMRMKHLIPDLPAQTERASLEVQRAKSKEWVPEISMSDLLNNDPLVEKHLHGMPPIQDAPRVLSSTARRVSVWLYWLRICGSIRAILRRSS